jgi:predicted nucleic acid-binding protein
MTTPADFGLKHGDLVLLDSGPLIYFLEGRDEAAGLDGLPSRASLVAAFLDMARAGELALVASTLAWTEVLRGGLATSAPLRTREARSLLADSRLLRLEPLDVAIAEEAACLLAQPLTGGRRGAELADAIHLATALVLGVSAILTNDEAWPDILASCASVASEHKKGRGLPRVLLVDELRFGLS